MHRKQLGKVRVEEQRAQHLQIACDRRALSQCGNIEIRLLWPDERE